jgi:tRNA threonylcarbamoyladenosine biosynthesis protein TsaB
VLSGDRVAAWRLEPMQRGQAEALMPMVVAVLAEAGADWRDIGLIGVTVGPGTFTGLRIGLAAARGMALAGGLPVAGVTTAEAFAHAVPQAERLGARLVVAIDGKRADAFVQPFGEDLAPQAPLAALMPAEVAALARGLPLVLAGDAAPRVAPHCPEARLSSVVGPPDPRVVARLAAARFVAGRALPPVPLYLRPPDVTVSAAR